MLESHLDNRIFWPVMVTISIAVAVWNRSRLGKLATPHMIWLLVYLAFAGTSVLWAFQPGPSLVRFTQQVMVVISIALPAMLARDMSRSLFLCFALILILNILFAPPPNETGWGGYFLDKNSLGQFTAIAFILALHEALYPGFRRAVGMLIVVIASTILFLAGSKTSLGFAFLAPLLAAATLIIKRTTRISPAIIIFTIVTFGVYFKGKVGWYIFHDTTFTGRTLIWDFLLQEIESRPLLGWGYQSFWLVPNSPAFQAPGWVSLMPEGHNGYMDVTVELGYVGLACLIMFIMTALHAAGRLANRDPARAWLMLSLIIFVIAHNLLETSWMRGYNLVWMVFLVTVGQVAGYSQLSPLKTPAHNSRIRRSVNPSLSQATRIPATPGAARDASRSPQQDLLRRRFSGS
jgi:exopolysaccharide production protein ExoQ